MKNAIGPISILGDRVPGQTLIIRGNGAKDPDGINYSTIAYKWYMNNDLVEEGQTIRVTGAMQGKTMKATMEFEDRKGNPEILITKEEVIPYSDERLKTLNVLYTYLLKRQPDDAGLRFWAGYLEKLENENHPTALAKVIEAFMSSDSYKAEIEKL